MEWCEINVIVPNSPADEVVNSREYPFKIALTHPPFFVCLLLWGLGWLSTSLYHHSHQ